MGSLQFLKHVYDGLFGVYGYSFEPKTYLDNLQLLKHLNWDYMVCMGVHLNLKNMW
jgi:hypothetical protein